MVWSAEMHRPMKSVVPTLMISALLLAGCGGQSYKEVTDKSIVDVGLPANLLTNPGFEDGRLSPWTVLYPRGASVSVTSTGSHSGGDSLRIALGKISPKETVSISQSVASLPVRSKGARYKMSMWVRTRALSKEVPLAMRMGYEDGSYAFVTGDAGKEPVLIPGGNRGWRELEVTAEAAEPMSSIAVFPVDSPADFTGTLWIDDVRLSVVQ